MGPGITAVTSLANQVSAQQWFNAILRAVLWLALGALVVAALVSTWHPPLSAHAQGLGLTLVALAFAVSGAADRCARRRVR